MTRSLRMPGESDQEFRHRAERAAAVGRLLVQAALANHDIREMIADPGDPHRESDIRRNPIVRVDYDQAFAIATIGEGLYATRHKHWGDGPQILPLEPDDPVRGTRIIYVFKENSLYNRRFEQRRKLKRLLGKKYRKLVSEARTSKRVFAEQLTPEHALAIRRLLGISPTEFWRASNGRIFLELPDEVRGRITQDEIQSLPPKCKQLPLFRMGPKTREDFAREHERPDETP